MLGRLVKNQLFFHIKNKFKTPVYFLDRFFPEFDCRKVMDTVWSETGVRWRYQSRKSLGEVSQTLSESDLPEPFAWFWFTSVFQLLNLAETLMPFKWIYILLAFIPLASALFLQEKLYPKYNYSSPLQKKKKKFVQIALISFRNKLLVTFHTEYFASI